jgi:hypothetical protein
MKAKGPPQTPRSLVTSSPAAQFNAAVVKARLSRYLDYNLWLPMTGPIIVRHMNGVGSKECMMNHDMQAPPGLVIAMYWFAKACQNRPIRYSARRQ